MHNFGFDLTSQLYHMRFQEKSYHPKANYMDWHTHVTPKMRMILIFWLSEVCEEYGLQRETFYMAINFFDRFLSAIPVITRDKLQLVGVACLFIACTIEEQQYPSSSVLALLTDGACSRDQINQMEKLVLQKIGWQLMPPTSNLFLRLYLLKNVQISLDQSTDKSLDKSTDQIVPTSPSHQLSSLSSAPSSSIPVLHHHPNNIDHNDNTNIGDIDYNNNNNNRDNQHIPDQHINFYDLIQSELMRTVHGNKLYTILKYFPKDDFVRMIQVIDAAMMDIKSMKHNPSMIAASALHLMYIPNADTITDLTGYDIQQLKICIQWLKQFTSISAPKPMFHFGGNFNIQIQENIQTSNMATKTFYDSYKW
eukprot:TRINITY_DN2737_c0_g1_i2.p1 TRINITY_DN2737_c0_g1~~TRINITY_DN2737_c0_g1_i2.p1  ORF type:complete len:365 (+),score=78.24 TRINITY_DN2737_c0_g1_i2:497-1591(+)